MSNSRPVALIIDDAFLDSKILSGILRKLGISSTSLFSEREVCKRLSESRFDLCFVDLNVSSEMSGIEVIKEIRETLGDAPKVIVISGQTDPATVSESLEAGADDFIAKPFNLTSFGTKLAHHFQTPELEDFRAPMVRVPSLVSEVDIEINVILSEVTPDGVELKSDSLLNKDTVFYLSGEVIKKIVGTVKPVLVTVTSSWAKTDTGYYHAFAEFDKQDLDLRAAVRSWLATRKGKAVLG